MHPNRQRNARACPAFTLVELLVVIGIIGVLAALLLPALTTARRQAAKTVAKSDIGNLSTAIAQFKADWGVYPPHSYRTGDCTIRLPGSSAVIPRDNDLAFRPDAAPEGNRSLIFFLTSRIEGTAGEYGPYLAPRKKQMRKTDDRYNQTYSGSTLKSVMLWDGSDWDADSGSAADLELWQFNDPFDEPYVYYSNEWADGQTGAVKTKYKPFSFILFSCGQDKVTAWNDSTDNDKQNGMDNADDNEKLTFDAMKLTHFGNLNGTLTDDLNSWD